MGEEMAAISLVNDGRSISITGSIYFTPSRSYYTDLDLLGQLLLRALRFLPSFFSFTFSFKSRSPRLLYILKVICLSAAIFLTFSVISAAICRLYSFLKPRMSFAKVSGCGITSASIMSKQYEQASFTCPFENSA
ncbi:hypothetical protein DVH24_026157 [Malus domestica]|uniref:Uncharacterized protein n=1 Tax=Malus domestica TaxID=3750 RepID=A0A498KFS8_MALDO|nr:hypothetical protein DVH24_026155 [Malus domestica]RXI07021.1 hypothetical protein DVH24_026157 [Malus domestica]